jgi:hypothetical protein
MRPNYWIWWGYCYEDQIEVGPSRHLAIELLRAYRAAYPANRTDSDPNIFRPDDIDVDNSTGLNQADRDAIDQAGLS